MQQIFTFEFSSTNFEGTKEPDNSYRSSHPVIVLCDFVQRNTSIFYDVQQRGKKLLDALNPA